MMGRLAVFALPLILFGCQMDLGDAPFLCCKQCDPMCPPGYECKSNYCIKEGSCPSILPECKNAQKCGNGSCDTGETCSSCASDCGACPKNCGNGSCDSDETCTNCSQDCGACSGKCGNGKCEPGETTTSCPADCQGSGCTENTTKCDGKDNIKVCEKSVWKTYVCKTVCTSGTTTYDYTTGCKYSSDKKKDLCLCGKYGGFGSLCNSEVLCDPSLQCGQFDTNKPGYCTKNCTTPESTCFGAPPGTSAKCVLTIANKNACGFICDGAPCPKGLTCDAADNHLCKP